MSGADKRQTGAEIPRRELLRGAGAGAAALVAGGVGARALAPDEPEPGIKAKRLAMAIDLGKCTGCMACAVACKAENGVRLGGFRSWVSERESGAYPSVRRTFLPRLCNQCQNPPCLDVCPTGATFRQEDGVVAIDKQKCIGCRHCVGACPYNARYFNPGPIPEGELPYPSRAAGTVDKCDFCSHRVARGVAPACVNTCPTEARTFGDLFDPASEISQLLDRKQARGLLQQFGTGPNVLYLGADPGIFEDPDSQPHPGVRGTVKHV